MSPRRLWNCLQTFMKSLYGDPRFHLASLWRSAHHLWRPHTRGQFERRHVLRSTREERFARLEQRLRRARVITAELISDVIAQACLRFAAHGAAAKAAVNRLIESGAWTDAALALVELELPQWKLRRIVHDNGEWYCSLSRQPQLPFGLDDIAEASHEILALAILMTLLEARRAAAVNAAGRTAVPQVSKPSSALCCDNFA
jgi:hypothetical protein